MFDIKKVQEEAEKEMAEERAKRAKEKIKAKIREVDVAKKILANHQRELEDLYGELSQD